MGACLFAEFSVACPLQLELLGIVAASVVFLAPSFTMAELHGDIVCSGRESVIGTILAFVANFREPLAQVV